MAKAVICPGHAVFLEGDPAEDSSWVLQSFQVGEPRFYLEHLRHAIERTAGDPTALLILSGGYTRAEAGRRSEAESYLEAAQALEWFGYPEVARRTALEEFARDSAENLLFGICRFREVTGDYPDHVTVTGWDFKRGRFDLHRKTIEWPAERFTYDGVNQPVALEAALAGERRALEDLHKRERRNPFGRQHGYQRSCPEMFRFLDTITITTETAT